MAIGAIPQNDYVIMVKYRGTTHVDIFGVFDNYSAAFAYRRDRIAPSVESAIIKPIQGIG